jgi:hypothetical protein
MKKDSSLYFLFVLIFFYSSCKKENDSPLEHGYRVTSETTYIDDKLDMKIDYAYEGNKLDRKNYYVFSNPDWVNTNKEEYFYPSEEMSYFIHYLNTGLKTWREEYKIECYYSNARMVKWLEYEHSEGAWNATYEEEFIYNQEESLTEWTEYYYDKGVKIKLYQEQYHYTGKQITSADISEIQNGSFVLFAKFALSYNTELLKNILVTLREIGSWRENSKVDLSYLNNELQSAGLSFNQDGTWYQTDTWSFNYDENGNLTGELQDNLYHYDVKKIEYTYEHKDGNAGEFIPPMNWVMGGYWYPRVTMSSNWSCATSPDICMSK